MKLSFSIVGLQLMLCLPVMAQTRALYDFVVPRDGTLAEAIQAANNRSDTEARFRIFIMPGDYVLPADSSHMVMGSDSVMYPDPITYLSASNTSFIGEDYNTTCFTNSAPKILREGKWGPACPLEGIGKGDVLNIRKKVENTYFQGVKMMSSMGDKHGRDIVLDDNGNKTIMKECCLWGFQDTYVSHVQGRYYFEGGVIRGNTDYVCGKGDVWYNQVTLRTKGGYLAVPSKPLKYGYIFDRCRIVSDGENGNGSYTLGRPWGQGTPIALFLNTTMEITPKEIGWNDMGKDGYPARFAEYNSRDAQGNPVSLSGRKRSFSSHENCNNPELTAEEAAQYSIELVMGGDDGWEPRNFTRQVDPVKGLKLKKGTLNWKHQPDALLYAIVRNGKVVDFTISNSYQLPADAAKDDTWAVRCANQMGGLGKAAELKK